MTNITRRTFLLSTLAAGMSLALSKPALAAVPRVVVVGGGFAGATAAKYLKLWGKNSLEVVLVEPNATYTSPILSNLVLNGQTSLNQLQFNYQALQSYGVIWEQDKVSQINAAAQNIMLASGKQLTYERIILAPGIEFEPITGLDSQKVPHAWKAGSQTTLLAQQLQAMPTGGTFILTIPKAPFRCPPGPYERACVVADLLNRTKLGSKVMVLDANADIVVEKKTFSTQFNFQGITYIPNTQVVSVDSDTKSVQVNENGTLKTYPADVLNVIPNQTAAQIILDNGLANDISGKWAEVNPVSYESTHSPKVHIIGDSQATLQPKAGHVGNSEAKVCASAILQLLSGQQPYADPVTNSACYSPVSISQATWLSAVYRINPTTGQLELKQVKEAFEPSSKFHSEMMDWAGNLFADTFK